MNSMVKHTYTSETLTLLFPTQMILLLLILTTFVLAFLVHKHCLLRTPKLTVQTIPINKILMRAALGNTTLSQHNDDIRVVNGSEPVCNKDRCTFLLLHKRVDVREKRLLCMRIQSRSLKKFKVSAKSSV